MYIIELLQQTHTNSAEYKAAKFLQAWWKYNLKNLIKNSQTSWKANNFNMPTFFDHYFKIKEILSVEYIGTKTNTPVFKECLFKIKTKTFNQTEEFYIKMNIICEIEEYQPSEIGKWGVNPISCIKIFKSEDIDFNEFTNN